jgi:mRNA interferase MazF
MKAGDVCLIEFISFGGHEQAGLRPAIIMSRGVANIIPVVPLTSKVEALKYEFNLEILPSKKNGLNNKSVAMNFQLRAVDKRRIIKKIGEIEEDILEKIKSDIKKMLELK